MGSEWMLLKDQKSAITQRSGIWVWTQIRSMARKGLITIMVMMTTMALTLRLVFPFIFVDQTYIFCSLMLFTAYFCCYTSLMAHFSAPILDIHLIIILNHLSPDREYWLPQDLCLWYSSCFSRMSQLFLFLLFRNQVIYRKFTYFIICVWILE